MTGDSANVLHPRGGGALRVLTPVDPLFPSALALVLTGRHGLGAAAEIQIQNLRRAVDQQRLKLELIVAAVERSRLVTAAMAIESPGRTALVYTPPGLEGSRYPQALADALRLLGRTAAPRGVSLLQALLGGEDERRAQVYASAGFTYLAELIYMERSTAEQGEVRAPSPTAARLKLVPYTPRRKRLFREALAASYANSLDCPKLNGLRDLDDVLAGHMATGLFEASGWTVAVRDEQPVGVVLAAMLPSRTAVEVVYMGVAPAARGQGVGNVLMATALAYARRLEAPTLSLAVDSTNGPARRLYARWKLHETTRRRAWITLLGARA